MSSLVVCSLVVVVSSSRCSRHKTNRMKALQIIAESELMAETFSIVTIHSTFFFFNIFSLFSLCHFFFTITYGSFFFFSTQIGTYILDIVLSFDHVDFFLSNV